MASCLALCQDTTFQYPAEKLQEFWRCRHIYYSQRNEKPFAYVLQFLQQKYGAGCFFPHRLLLLNQFHDVIPGSCIEMVVEDALRYYEGTVFFYLLILFKAMGLFSFPKK